MVSEEERLQAKKTRQKKESEYQRCRLVSAGFVVALGFFLWCLDPKTPISLPRDLQTD